MIVSLAFVASLIGWSAPATSAATLCATPPPVVDVSSLTPGTTGTAWTVVEGTTPVSFDVEVLGVLPDGIAPGIDFILIQVSGPVIDETGGIAAGMSGSPVYVGGDLAGAISYGFFGADPTIGGMTPAAAMVHVLDFPQPPSPAPVKLDASLQRTFARASDATTVAAALAVAKPITVPLSVSGLGASSGKAQSRLQHWMTKNGSPFAVTTGASAQAPGGAPLGAPPVAGGAIGAAYSYGDATFGAIGTATFVCDDEVVAFGHPFNHSGETTLALTNANIIHTIPDPSQVFGAFKFGQITDTSGIVTQDRLAGIAGITGTGPELTPVTSESHLHAAREVGSGFDPGGYTGVPAVHQLRPHLLQRRDDHGCGRARLGHARFHGERYRRSGRSVDGVDLGHVLLRVQPGRRGRLLRRVPNPE